MQVLVRCAHLGHNPGALLLRPGGAGAGLNHPGKGLIHGHHIAAGLERTAEAAVEVQGFGKQHAARVRRPPENGAARTVPGENALRVGGDESLQAQVAAHSQQPVGLGLFRGGKDQTVSGQEVNGHGSIDGALRGYPRQEARGCPPGGGMDGVRRFLPRPERAWRGLPARLPQTGLASPDTCPTHR